MAGPSLNDWALQGPSNSKTLLCASLLTALTAELCQQCTCSSVSPVHLLILTTAIWKKKGSQQWLVSNSFQTVTKEALIKLPCSLKTSFLARFSQQQRFSYYGGLEVKVYRLDCAKPKIQAVGFHLHLVVWIERKDVFRAICIAKHTQVAVQYDGRCYYWD